MSDELRLAVVINPDLPLGSLANTVAAISIGLGAASPILAGARLTDGAGREITVSANRPVPILQAAPEIIQGVLLRALPPPEGGTVVPFPHFARSLHAFADYAAVFPDRDLAGEVLDGLGICGPSKWVRSLTGALKLLR